MKTVIVTAKVVQTGTWYGTKGKTVEVPDEIAAQWVKMGAAAIEAEAETPAPAGKAAKAK